MATTPGTHTIAIVAFDGISPFHLSVPNIVFGDDPGAGYRVVVCAEKTGTLRTDAGFGIAVDHTLSALRRADTVIVPSWVVEREVPEVLIEAIRRAHRRGARIVGLCLGAFVVAASGVADGRAVTTHWHAADDLAAQYPSVTVRSDVLWTDLGDVVTSAGTVAGLDCCLHLVRRDHGSDVAAGLARRLVMAPHRDGSQAQHIPAPLPPAEPTDAIADAMVWARANLDQIVDLDRWARQATMSRRTFTRQFRLRTGDSPSQWLLRQRLDHARSLLETTTTDIESIAAASGFGSAITFRTHFRQAFDVSPRDHRRGFARTGPE